MTDRKTKEVVKLDWPIEIGDGKHIGELTVRRPRGKAIKRVIALIGPDAIQAVLSDATTETARQTAATAVIGLVPTGEDLPANQKRSADIVRRLVDHVASFATAAKLDELTEVIALLVDQPVAIVDEIDPDDYSKLFGALTGFFPDLFSKAGAA